MNSDDLHGLLGHESDDDFQYEEVEILDDEEEDNASEDLESALRSLGIKNDPIPRSTQLRNRHDPAPGETIRGAEVVDDFVRNFLLRHQMDRTLDVFEEEWFKRKSTSAAPGGAGGSNGATEPLPDVYAENESLELRLRQVERELDTIKTVAGKATGTWDKLRKERDFHRMNHRRVAQEKNRLITDIQRLKKHYATYEPTIVEIRNKYEASMKEKMMTRLERDRLAAKVEALEAMVRQLEEGGGGGGGGGMNNGGSAPPLPSSAGGTTRPNPSNTTNTTNNNTTTNNQTRKATGLGDSNESATSRRPVEGASLSATNRPNPFLSLQFPRTETKSYRNARSVDAHAAPIVSLALHPTKPILVTASDDHSWKMWHLPNGELIMHGEGHRDWVAGVDFHPRGTHLASCSGDTTVKVWDFEQQRCMQTLHSHSAAVWDVAWHDTGSFVASGSMDRTARVWDVTTGKCRQVCKGHVDSVNAVQWQPYSSILCTASSDKTVSLWDTRTGLCTQTLYGHHNSVNYAVVDLRGVLVASCDADGVVKMWDTRMVSEVASANVGTKAANKLSLDRSGQIVAVASEDGHVRCVDVGAAMAASNQGQPAAIVADLQGHEGPAQAVVFDMNGVFLASAGSDGTYKIWQ